MKITIDAAAKNLRDKSHFYSNGFAENLITPAAQTRFKDNLAVKAAKKETCVICFDDDVYSDLMFLVGNCGHRFCGNCVQQHIQVKLLDGTIPNCLERGCKSQLCIDTCVKLLTPKLIWMWKQRIKEDSTPLNERVYCPNRSCGYLMSNTELFSLPLSFSGYKCFKCGAFCVCCKVPWHDSLSCTDYQRLYSKSQTVEDVKKLKSLASIKGWRQCPTCKHMVERSYGCKHMTCRCGNGFCYGCGDNWNGLTTGHGNCINRNDHGPNGGIECLIQLMCFGLIFLAMFLFVIFGHKLI